jgi:hypothetical protein
MIAAAVSSIERRLTSITGQPWRLQETARLGNLAAHGIEIDIIGLIVLGQHPQPVPPHLHKLRRILGQSDDQGTTHLQEFGRQWTIGNGRDVGSLDAAIG